jgi:Organic solute transporter Ostalpha
MHLFHVSSQAQDTLISIALVGIVAIALQASGRLCPQSLSLSFGNSWLSIVKGISTTFATYFVWEWYFVIRLEATP